MMRSFFQLNILPEKKSYYEKDYCQFHSLYEVLDNTQTALGKRLLKCRILSPITDAKILNERYDRIDILISLREIAL